MVKNFKNMMLKRSLTIFLGFSIPLLLLPFLLHFSNAWLLLAVIPILFGYFSPQIYGKSMKAKIYKGKYRKKLLSLAKKHNINLKELYYSDKHMTAIALGLFKNKIVICQKNILETPWKELKALYLHEFAHFRNKDLVYLTFYPAIVYVVFGIYAVNKSSTILVEFFTALIFAAIISFFHMAYMRSRERKADLYAVKEDAKAWNAFAKRTIKRDKLNGITFPKKITKLEQMFMTHPWVYDRIKYKK